MPPDKGRAGPVGRTGSESTDGGGHQQDTAPCPRCAGTGRLPAHPGDVRQHRALARLAALAMPWLVDMGGA
jgi:hypothetical protein